MKKLILILSLALASFSASAQHYHGGYYRHGYGWGGVVGGVIAGVAIDRMMRPPVIIQQYPQYPIYQQIPPIDPCINATEYLGVYNPSAARAYCQGQNHLNQQVEQQIINEAYRRGANGQ